MKLIRYILDQRQLRIKVKKQINWLNLFLD